jgi:hypothetical protein
MRFAILCGDDRDLRETASEAVERAVSLIGMGRKGVHIHDTHTDKKYPPTHFGKLYGDLLGK